MAAPINSIAATFTTTMTTPKPSLIPSTSLSWNPHSSLSWTHKTSLLDLYGSPPPLPISAVRSPRRLRTQSLRSPDINPMITTYSVGAKLPSAVPLSHLDRNGVVRGVSLGGLLKGKRRALVVGVSAAFSPGCERFLRRVESGVDAFKAADLIACVATNDAFVMSAWGEHLAVDGAKWKTVSDGGGELWKELGVLSMRNFWLSARNGIVTHIGLDGDDDDSDP